MEPITTSIFELLKIGPGPSSSHTIGPMRAGADFLARCRALPQADRSAAVRLTATLLGSLSATGRGHGTDKAVLAGLQGRVPESCPARVLTDLAEDPDADHVLDLDGAGVSFRLCDVEFGPVIHSHAHPNTLILALHGPGGVLLEQAYYSVGGGFLQWEGWTPPERGAPVHPYSDMNSLKALLRDKGMRLHQVILENEQAVTGACEADVLAGLDRLMEAMLDSVERGLDCEGVLPGRLGVNRKAASMSACARDKSHRDRFLLMLNAYAFAVAEENGAGHCVVTAPTAGAAGVMPAVLKIMRETMKIKKQDRREALLAASAVGFLAKHNASIAGAEVGCQGEVGVASAMAAAMLAYGAGFRFRVTENAAEIALEHHLGLTCDPVDGLVQIPCIERCAMGAVKAYNAFLIASHENEAHHVVDLDRAIEAMAATGRDMNAKYKETSEGGLAVSLVEC